MHTITPNAFDISGMISFLGSDCIMVGKGTDLPISHADCSILSLSNVDSIKHMMYLWLLVLLKDFYWWLNLARSHYWICTSSTYCIKHMKSIPLLNQGPLDGGLYSLESSANNVCFVTNKCSIDLWHTHLNHPSNQILNHLRHEWLFLPVQHQIYHVVVVNHRLPLFHYGD